MIATRTPPAPTATRPTRWSPTRRSTTRRPRLARRAAGHCIARLTPSPTGKSRSLQGFPSGAALHPRGTGGVRSPCTERGAAFSRRPGYSKRPSRGSGAVREAPTKRRPPARCLVMRAISERWRGLQPIAERPISSAASASPARHRVPTRHPHPALSAAAPGAARERRPSGIQYQGLTPKTREIRGQTPTRTRAEGARIARPYVTVAVRVRATESIRLSTVVSPDNTFPAPRRAKP